MNTSKTRKWMRYIKKHAVAIAVFLMLISIPGVPGIVYSGAFDAFRWGFDRYESYTKDHKTYADDVVILTSGCLKESDRSRKPEAHCFTDVLKKDGYVIIDKVEHLDSRGSAYKDEPDKASEVYVDENGLERRGEGLANVRYSVKCSRSRSWGWRKKSCIAAVIASVPAIKKSEFNKFAKNIINSEASLPGLRCNKKKNTERKLVCSWGEVTYEGELGEISDTAEKRTATAALTPQL